MRVPASALLSTLAFTLAAACTSGTASPGEETWAPEESPTAASTSREPPATRELLADELAESRRTAIVSAAERVAPAVVSINVARRERVVPRSIFEQMLLPPGYEREVAGLGSGFVIRGDGLVVTNEHVVRGATQVVVTFPDGREFDADVVGSDDVNDLAVVRLRLPRGEHVPVAPLGTSDDLMIGEWVVAIGNPFGYLLSNPEPSVTAGVVSATGRNIIQGDGQRGYYLDMIQTDASINPGNSGGALVNARGEVVGVNASILSSTGGNEGLGFAIPIDRARRIAVALADEGRYRRGWVGAQVEAAPSEGLRRVRDVRVGEVVPASPAERAGMRPGMIVRSVGRKVVRTPLDWEAGLLNAAAGETLEVRVDDGGRERVLRLRPEDVPSMAAERIQALRDFQLVTLTPAIRAERGLRSEHGALVVGLSDDARRVGIREGDLILQINRTAVRTAEEAARVLQQLRGSGVAVYFERGGRIGTAQFTIGR